MAYRDGWGKNPLPPAAPARRLSHWYLPSQTVKLYDSVSLDCCPKFKKEISLSILSSPIILPIHHIFLCAVYLHTPQYPRVPNNLVSLLCIASEILYSFSALQL